MGQKYPQKKTLVNGKGLKPAVQFLMKITISTHTQISSDGLSNPKVHHGNAGVRQANLIILTKVNFQLQPKAGQLPSGE